MFVVKVDPRQVLGYLDEVQKQQLPYATSVALNRVANLAQTAERQRIKAAYKLRRQEFNLRGVYISKADRANKSTWQVTIQISPQTDYLVRSEQGTPHTPAHGKWLWKPNSAIFQDKPILRSSPYYPSKIKFDSAGKAPNGIFKVQRPGQGPLILQRVAAGARGVAQSISRGGLRGPRGRDAATGRYTQGEAIKGLRRGGVRMLYQLVSRSRVPAKLEFMRTITASVQSNWQTEMTRAMTEAVRTAR